ncbi:family 78 glycoside hydrolase catalytic domain [Tessaracoccus coleopterorum]|uniref:family 78 glycoside hydrolase catalytic domain n=1 Tax=Tessaracoccus coleopterorum TaxID=2714950 RepID=UPI0018D49256
MGSGRCGVGLEYTGNLRDRTRGSGEWADAEWIGSGKSLSEAWRDTTITFRASGIAGHSASTSAASTATTPTCGRSTSRRGRCGHTSSPTAGSRCCSRRRSPPGSTSTRCTGTRSRSPETRSRRWSTIRCSTSGRRRPTPAPASSASAPTATSGSHPGHVRHVLQREVLLDTTFAAGDRTFTGGTVSGGTLRLAGNVEAWLAKGTEVPILRTEFDLDKPVASARVYASARGVYELRLNGEKVGDQELAPGWTDYRKRIAYQSYDVTDQLAAGGNAFSAELADGWYSGRVASFGDSVYGTDTSLIAQLRVTYTDGTEETIATDETWRTAPSATISADILDGEAFDAGRAAELGAWDSPGYDDAQWAAADVRDERSDVLEPQIDPPVRVTEEITGTRMPDPVAGAFIYDLGQNMVGRTRVTMQGEPGTTVRIRVAEVLNPDGTLYTDNFRSAKATDYFTFGPDGTATWEPRFTFHGFRYVELTGLTQAPAAGKWWASWWVRTTS